MLRQFRIKVVALSLVSVYLAVVSPGLVMAADNASLSGILYNTDGKTPLKNAVLKLRNQSSGAEFASQPSNVVGEYAIASLPAGEYAVRLTFEGKECNFNHPISLKAGVKDTLSFSLCHSKKGGLLLLIGGTAAVITGVVIAATNDETPSSPAK